MKETYPARIKGRRIRSDVEEEKTAFRRRLAELEGKQNEGGDSE